MVCLDSDIIIEFLKNNKIILNKINDLQEKENNISTTSINTFEVLRGFVNYKSDSINRFNNFLSNLKIYNFNFPSSKKAAEIFEELKSRGEMLDLADIMIASIAISNNETLLTNNISHFKRIPELKIEKI
jgi:tRNA(fMet)-specific endonuclease VapC